MDRGKLASGFCGKILLMSFFFLRISQDFPKNVLGDALSCIVQENKTKIVFVKYLQCFDRLNYFGEWSESDDFQPCG